MVDIHDLGNFYAENGYVDTKLINSATVELLASEAKQFLMLELDGEVELCDYHQHILSEEHHRDFHYRLTQFLRSKEIHKRLVADNRAIFTNLVGLDVDVQVEPYFRISRPGEVSDNIGMHRDTFYGNSPHEISCILPLAKFHQGAGVSVWPGSQYLGDISYEQNQHPSIAKGSKQNQIGFLYAPKEIINIKYEELYTPLLDLGECLLFSLGLVHGQQVNSSQNTRWSMDFRFKSSNAVEQDDLRSGYYERLLYSPATKVAIQYNKSNFGE